MKLEFPRQNFEKSSNIIFMKIRPVGAELFHEDSRTAIHDEDNRLNSQFFEGVWKPIANDKLLFTRFFSL